MVIEGSIMTVKELIEKLKELGEEKQNHEVCVCDGSYIVIHPKGAYTECYASFYH